MALKLKTPPAVDPVTLAEAKAYCRVDHADDDVLIASLIKAATAHCDGNRGVLGRAIINQEWELYYDAFPAEALKIPLGPLVAVTSVEYAHPATGVMTVWPSANYEVDLASWEGWIVPVDQWPDTKDTINAVRITFTAGHGSTASAAPADIKQAILTLVAHWYAHREAINIGSITSEIPLMFDALIAAIRKGPV